MFSFMILAKRVQSTLIIEITVKHYIYKIIRYLSDLHIPDNFEMKLQFRNKFIYLINDL